MDRMFFKVARMNKTASTLLIFLAPSVCSAVAFCADNSSSANNGNGQQLKLNKQLKINQKALLEGSSEQMRIDAATVMLFSLDPQARNILLEALRQSENSPARIAVCRALSQTRAGHEAINNKDDFIEPLLSILATQSGVEARLAAEATLIFEYKQVSRQLENMVTDSKLLAQARLNAVDALKLQPDKMAILKLIELLNDSEPQVAKAAENALQSLGIPVAGKDAGTIKQIINEIERKGRDEFLRDWLLRQDERMNVLEAEIDMWRKSYVELLDKMYERIGDDSERAALLIEELSSDEQMVRLWALEKVFQWRRGTRPKLPAELEPALTGLISDPGREVRLKTAGLLSLMSELDSSQKLLEQMEAETDEKVRTELFVALGGATYYAFLPDSETKVDQQIRKRTLEWAAKFLADADPQKAQKGAEVIKKLLEKDGLSTEEVKEYLGLLARRFNKSGEEANGALRGELLNAMAGLCAQSVYKVESAKLFGPLFEKSLQDETDLVREAAVQGLISIDSAKAMKILRRNSIHDSSVVVRRKLIELAGKVGDKQDLGWLLEKTSTTAEGELSWQAMMKIFNRSDVSVLTEWIAKLESVNGRGQVSDEQMESILKMAERKASGENKQGVVNSARSKLADIYRAKGDWQQAAEYLGMLGQSAQTQEEREKVTNDLFEVYLQWDNVELATPLIANRLSESDLDLNSVVVTLLDNYFNTAESDELRWAMLEALSKITTGEPRLKWDEQLEGWLGRFSKVEEPNTPDSK